MSACCLVLALPVQAAAQQPRATARVPKAEVTVGEPFVVDVSVAGPAGSEWSFPAEHVSDAIELRAAAVPAAATPADTKTDPPPTPGQRYQASVFAIGEVAVPPLTIRYRLPDGSTGEVVTEPLPLRVVSLLPKEAGEQKLADIRGPGSVGIGRAFWIAVAASLVALAVGGWLWWRRRRRAVLATAGAPLPVQAPDAEALQALAALAAGGHLGRGDARGYYIELSMIAKRYLERRLEVPFLEMTSHETLAVLRDHAQAGPLLGAVRDVTTAADLVKFARGQALHDEAERHLAAVRSLVVTLEARLTPVPLAGPATPGAPAARVA